MNDGRKTLQVVLFLGLALSTFAGGFFLLQKDNPAPIAPPANAERQAEEEKAQAPDKPPKANPPDVAENAKPAAPKVAPLAAVKSAPVAKTETGTWTLKTIWGLPKPRKLTAKEKQALAQLGTVEDVQDFKFSRVVLDDGSVIPGKPAPDATEVTRRMVDKVRTLGLADGFEAMIHELAVFNLNHLSVPVSNAVSWKSLEATLGPPDGSSEGDVYLKGPPRVYYRVAWKRYGWLEFGVGQDRVRVVRAEMRHAEIVPAESIPGGRTPPDPAKAMRSRRTRKGDESEALRLLGQAAAVRVTARKGVKPDQNFDIAARDASDLIGKDLDPNMLEMARKFKKSSQVDYLLVTPNKSCSIEQILDILGETNMTSLDTTTLPGQTLKWYRFVWIEFGAIDKDVKRVRMQCVHVPSASK